MDVYRSGLVDDPLVNEAIDALLRLDDTDINLDANLDDCYLLNNDCGDICDITFRNFEGTPPSGTYNTGWDDWASDLVLLSPSQINDCIAFLPQHVATRTPRTEKKEVLLTSKANETIWNNVDQTKRTVLVPKSSNVTLRWTLKQGQETMETGVWAGSKRKHASIPRSIFQIEAHDARYFQDWKRSERQITFSNYGTHNDNDTLRRLRTRVLEPITKNSAKIKRKLHIQKMKRNTVKVKFSSTPIDEARKVSSKNFDQRCNCMQFNCLKLYCDCFNSSRLCSVDCNCCKSGPTICANQKLSDIRSEALQIAMSASKKYCTCRKTECLKKYCICFAAGKPCNNMCRCTNCKNASIDYIDGIKQHSHGNTVQYKKRKLNTTNDVADRKVQNSN